MPTRLRPSRREGLNITYKLKDLGVGCTDIARTLNVHHSNICKVVSGQRRSKRIESEIARVLGKASWNDVVLEAQSEIYKKPVELILLERKQSAETAIKSSKKRMKDYIERDISSSDSKARGKLNRMAAGL
ncbi:MAG: hypothetical protein FWD24_01165 [Treponema sp.]|nr:hypothetical protein [Treponema sp.]